MASSKVFSFTTNIDQLAKALNTKVEEIRADVEAGAESLAIQAHSKILEYATSELKGYNLETYLGKGGENLTWKKVSDRLWVVALDPKAAYIEEGREPVSMATDQWLLKNAKKAKDGCVLNPRNKVLTSTGWKKIKDIVPGDMVLTHSGKFREVKKLLIQKAGIGTEYIRMKIRSYDNSNPSMKMGELSDLTFPAISLTTDHLVLTPDGWKEAGKLKKGDLIASPGDLRNPCLECGKPIPINVKKYQFCLNNLCRRKWAYKNGIGGFARILQSDRSKNSKKGHAAAKASGCFDRSDWGARLPSTLKKLRDASAAAMRKLTSSGKWAPEVFFEKCLTDNLIKYERERPIQTDRMVNAGRGHTRKSTLYFDFFIPSLNLAIELDGKHWHSTVESSERDKAKNLAAARDGIRLLRIPSHKIYKRGKRLAHHLSIWSKNHSGDLGISWVSVEKIIRGVVNRPDHVYAKKYDICLDAEEHSFCCETIFIHNSSYKVIPMPQGGSNKGLAGTNAALNSMAKKVIRDAKINMKTIERHENGSPKIGIVKKLNPEAPFTQSQAPSLFSKPRSAADAAKSGLKPHEGIFKLAGLAVTQKEGKNGKVSKEAVTFRVVSSKHRAEGRWMAPRVPAANFFQRTTDWINNEAWPAILKSIAAKHS